jgi:hypothetical protein
MAGNNMGLLVPAAQEREVTGGRGAESNHLRDTLLTIRCTSGSTRSSAGKATIQELAHALSHAESAPPLNPMFRAVDTPETMHDITIEVRSNATKLA